MSPLFKHILNYNCTSCSGEMEGIVSVSVFLNYILNQFLKNILLFVSFWYLSLPSMQFNELSLFKHRHVFSAVSYVPKSWVSQRILSHSETAHYFFHRIQSFSRKLHLNGSEVVNGSSVPKCIGVSSSLKRSFGGVAVKS